MEVHYRQRLIHRLMGVLKQQAAGVPARNRRQVRKQGGRLLKEPLPWINTFLLTAGLLQQPALTPSQRLRAGIRVHHFSHKMMI
jgi:hypothetical protein